jgi:DNA-binding transcriptional LysR family regulator
VQFLLCHTHSQAPGRLDSPAYRSLKVGTDTLVPVCAPDRAGRPRHVLSLRARKTVPLLAYSAESGLGRLVRALLGASLPQARVEPVFTAHLAAVLKSMALDGRGVAWLPYSMVDAELRDKRLAEAGDAAWRLQADIRLFRPDQALAPAAEAFWRAVEAAHGG